MCLGTVPLSWREVSQIFYSLYNYKVKRRLLMERLDIFHACNLIRTEKCMDKPRYGLVETMLARQLLHFQIPTDSEHSIQTPKYIWCLCRLLHQLFQTSSRFSSFHILKLSEHWYLSGANIPEYSLLTPFSAALIQNIQTKTKIKWNRKINI